MNFGHGKEIETGGLAIFQGLLAWQNDPKVHNERQILKDEQTEEEMGGQL